MTALTSIQPNLKNEKTDWPGLFIVFEGIDGTGKTCQLNRLADFLHKQKESVVTTKEPSDGHYGTQIRQLFYKRASLSKQEELQLFIEDRKDHLKRTVLPALENGEIVLCDRYFLSTVAYQGATGYFAIDELLALNNFAPAPDIALLFEAPLSQCIQRITTGRKETLNDFEQHSFLEKTDKIFSRLDFPWLKRVDCSGKIEEVEEKIHDHLTPLIREWKQKREQQ